MRASHLITFLLLSTSIGWAQSANDLVFHSELEKEKISLYVNSSSIDFLSLNLTVDPSITPSQLQEHKNLINQWTTFLKKKKVKYKTDKAFLSYMFYKVHRKLLKNYDQYTSLNETLTTNKYDCLTATTLYALLLDNLGYSYGIVETNYHIYLKIDLADSDNILIESTDPIYGFITDKVEIESRLKNYAQSNFSKEIGQGEYALKSDINTEVNRKSLVGLTYYNASVKAFNSGDIHAATILLEKGAMFYNSSRLKELAIVIAQSLLSNDNLANTEKRILLAKIPFIKNDKKEVVGVF